MRQCRLPNGGNRLQLIGIGSPAHKEPRIDIDEIANNQNVDAGGVARKQELKEISMVFPLKKLVQFAKAHCLDQNVGIHLDEKGYLILQYKIKIYGDLRFVVLSTTQENDSDDDDEEEEAAEEEQKGQKREREEGGADEKKEDDDEDGEEEDVIPESPEEEEGNLAKRARQDDE